MTANPSISLTAWRASATPLHTVAIVCTGFRLYHRYHKRRLWWDDFWVLFSLLCDLGYSITSWLRSDAAHPSSTYQRVVVFWLTAILFPLVVWSARMSMGMSIARLVPPKTRARYCLVALVICFSLMCAALLVQKLWVCCRDTSWHHNYAVQCYLGKVVGILSLCTDIVADACLVVIPLHMLWRVKLPRTQRRLILSIFACGILNSFTCVVYVVFVFGAQVHHTVGWGSLIGLSAHIKAAVSLLVSNMLVIVTYLYCLVWKDEDEDASEPSETRSESLGPREPTTVVTFTEISDMHTLDALSSSDYSRQPQDTQESALRTIPQSPLA